MLSHWMILAASLGQTTQPAEPVKTPATPAVTIAASADLPTTRPANPPVMRVSAPTTQPVNPLDSLDFSQFGELSGDPVDIQVTPDGSLIIVANEHDQRILEKVIGMMNKGIDHTFKLFKLKHASAGDIAPRIQEFWTKVKSPGTGKLSAHDKITVIAEPRANTLMVGATNDAMIQITSIIETLDSPAFGAEFDFHQVPLQHRQANEAAQILKDMLKAREQKLNISKSLFDITPVPSNNSLIISASKEDLVIIKQLIEAIDVEPTAVGGGVVKMAVYPLLKSVARDLADVLNDMLKTETDAAKAAKETIRRLQVQLRSPDGTPMELPPVDLEKPIKLFAEPGTNSIIVASIEQNLEPIGELIKLLDSVPLAEETMIRVFPLQFADGEALLANLRDMFDQGKNLPEQPGKTIPGAVPPGITGSMVYNIGLSSDKRTNTIIASGRMEQLLIVQQIIEAVDVEEHANLFVPRIIKLEYADPRRIAEIATKIADQRLEIAKDLGPTAEKRERVLISDDARTNSMIVVARDDNFNEIESLAKRLDTIPKDLLEDIHIVNLKNLTAADIADKIETLWERRLNLLPEGNLKQDQPVIVTDSRSNALIIASNKEDFAAIEALIQRLEDQKLNPMADIRMIMLEHNEAGRVADIVKNLFDERLKQSLGKGQEEQPSDRIAVVDEPMANAILIASSQSNFDEVKRLVEKLDQPPSVDSLYKIHYIRNADVKDVGEKLDKLFSDGIFTGVRDQELPESLKKVTIVPDMRSSALIVSASPQNMAIVDSLIKDLDRTDIPELPARWRFFQIEHADVVNVADMLDQLFEGMRDTLDDEADQLNVKLIPDIRSNTLIVAGTRYAVDRAVELIPKLDQKNVEPTSRVVVYDLKQAAAAQLQEVLTELFDKRADDDAKGKRTPITIIADDGSNSLIVTASSEDHLITEGLLTKLDRKSTLAEQMQIFPLARAKAKDISDTLTDLIEKQQNDRKAPFSVTPDERTNSLVIFAPPDLMRQIDKIVPKLDDARPKTEMAVKVFRLRNQNAEDFAELLDKFFEAAGAGKESEARQLIIRFTHIDPSTGVEMVRSLVHQDISITPDKATNTLLISAPDDHIEMMAMLIEMLDSVAPKVATVASFPLRNADATEMKELLEELFDPEQGEDGERRTLVIGGPDGAAGSPPAAGGSSSGSNLDIAFSVDRRTNTLIAAGSESYIKMVERLVLQLDYEEIDQRVVRVVPIHNKPADELAETLEEYFRSESDALESATTGEEAAVRQLERQVTVQHGGEA